MAEATLVFTVPVELKDVVTDIVERIVGIKDNIYSAASNATGEENRLYATGDAKEVEKEITKEKDEEKFTPPTFEEVRWYMRNRRSPVIPERFYNWMQKHNWHDGNGEPITDWKKKLEDWEVREMARRPNAQQPRPVVKEYKEDDTDRLLRMLTKKEDSQNT